MFLTPSTRVSVLLIPAWLALLGACYWLRSRRAAESPQEGQRA